MGQIISSSRQMGGQRWAGLTHFHHHHRWQSSAAGRKHAPSIRFGSGAVRTSARLEQFRLELSSRELIYCLVSAVGASWRPPEAGGESRVSPRRTQLAGHLGATRLVGLSACRACGQLKLASSKTGAT